MELVLEPAAVISGLVAICALFAAYLIAQIGAAIIDSVNLFGILDPIKNALTWFAHHVLDSMGWLWSKTNPVAVWIAGVNILHATEQGLHQALFGDVSSALQWIYHTAIPGAATWAVNTAAAAIAPFVAGVNAFISGVQGFIAWAHAQLAALWSAITVSIPGEIHAAVSVVEGDLSRVRDGVEADIAAARAAATGALAVAVAGVEGEVRDWIGTAVRGVEGDIGKVVSEIATDVLPKIAAIGVTVTAVEATIAKVEECTAGICGPKVGDTLGDLGKLLQGIEAVVTDVAIFALMTEAATNSRGLARGVIDVFGGPVSDAESLIRSHVSLPAA